MLGEDTEREPDEGGCDERHDPEKRRVGRRPSHERRHWPVVEERVAEVEPCCARDPQPPLRSRTPVQIEARSGVLDSFGEAKGPSCDVMSPGASRASNRADEDVTAMRMRAKKMRRTRNRAISEGS